METDGWHEQEFGEDEQHLVFDNKDDDNEN